MKLAKSPFNVWIEAEELPMIRQAIRAWGKPDSVTEAYGGARLHEHLERWGQFVETDWEDWDISEYDHDVGCRVWVQLVIENTGPETSERIQRAVEPLDASFKARMIKGTAFCQTPTPILRSHPYFWETHTIHPELACGGRSSPRC